MLGPVDYFLWFCAAIAEAAVIFCAWRARAIGRYLALNIYMLATLLATVARLWVLFSFGYRSAQYGYFYYYSDALLSILLYFTLMSLYARVFDEMQVRKHIQVATLLLLAGTALVTYQIVAEASTSGRILGPFIIELSRNLYFVGLVLVYLLWGAMMKLKTTSARLVQIVTALGVYMSGFAANYALYNMSHKLSFVWIYIPTMMGIALPVAWAYTFWKVPEGARLAPAGLTAAQGHR